MTGREIDELTMEIGAKHPIAYSYGSRCSLYQEALKAGEITEEQFHEASNYYGSIWHMAG